MLRTILYVIGALILLPIIVGLFLPSTAHVERSITIQAAPEQIWPYVNGYTHFNTWSPWADRDPDAVYTISGSESGVGARYEWQSDQPDVGSGAQEIILSEPYTRVETLLDFGDEGTGVAYFDLTPVDGGTEVTWGFDTDFGWNLIGRYFGLLFDGFIGPDYEEGLSNLQATVEDYWSTPRNPDGEAMPLPVNDGDESAMEPAKPVEEPGEASSSDAESMGDLEDGKGTE